MNSPQFYYVNENYIKYLKNAEQNYRGYTCVPNVHYWNINKFVFGAVLNLNSILYFAPVSSYNRKQEDLILLRDKRNNVLGSIRFNFMIPVPEICLKKVDINSLPTEYSRVHTSKELAFCRRERDKIYRQAQKTYNRVINRVDTELIKHSCDFKLLEKAYVSYCKENYIELSEESYRTAENLSADKADNPATKSPKVVYPQRSTPRKSPKNKTHER